MRNLAALGLLLPLSLAACGEPVDTADTDTSTPTDDTSADDTADTGDTADTEDELPPCEVPARTYTAATSPFPLDGLDTAFDSGLLGDTAFDTADLDTSLLDTALLDTAILDVQLAIGLDACAAPERQLDGQFGFGFRSARGDGWWCADTAEFSSTTPQTSCDDCDYAFQTSFDLETTVNADGCGPFMEQFAPLFELVGGVGLDRDGGAGGEPQLYVNIFLAGWQTLDNEEFIPFTPEVQFEQDGPWDKLSYDASLTFSDFAGY